MAEACGGRARYAHCSSAGSIAIPCLRTSRNLKFLSPRRRPGPNLLLLHLLLLPMIYEKLGTGLRRYDRVLGSSCLKSTSIRGRFRPFMAGDARRCLRRNYRNSRNHHLLSFPCRRESRFVRCRTAGIDLYSHLCGYDAVVRRARNWNRECRRGSVS